MARKDELGALAEEIASSCHATTARAQSRALTRDYDRRLAAADIRSTELAVLVAASVLGAARPHEIATMLSMDRSTVTRSVRSLGEKGWVRMEHESHRTRYVHLTASGEAKILEAYPLWTEAQQASAPEASGG